VLRHARAARDHEHAVGAELLDLLDAAGAHVLAQLEGEVGRHLRLVALVRCQVHAHARLDQHEQLRIVARLRVEWFGSGLG